MPRILILGPRPALLKALANVFAVRGNAVSVSTNAVEARGAMMSFVPQLVIWDADSHDNSLDPTHLGFKGPTMVLTHDANFQRNDVPGCRILRKPFSTDDLIAAVLESDWE